MPEAPTILRFGKGQTCTTLTSWNERQFVTKTQGYYVTRKKPCLMAHGFCSNVRCCMRIFWLMHLENKTKLRIEINVHLPKHCIQMSIQHQESVLRSMETSMSFSSSSLTVNGLSRSKFGGAKYMCRDIIQIIMPKKSCKENK